MNIIINIFLIVGMADLSVPYDCMFSWDRFTTSSFDNVFFGSSDSGDGHHFYFQQDKFKTNVLQQIVDRCLSGFKTRVKGELLISQFYYPPSSKISKGFSEVSQHKSESQFSAQSRTRVYSIHPSSYHDRT